MHEFLFFFPKLSPLLPLVVWYYKKKNSTTLQAMILGKITWKYMCWDRSTFRLTQSQTQVNLKMVQRRLYSPFELHLMTSSVTVRLLVYTGKSRRIGYFKLNFFVLFLFISWWRIILSDYQAHLFTEEYSIVPIYTYTRYLIIICTNKNAGEH